MWLLGTDADGVNWAWIDTVVGWFPIGNYLSPENLAIGDITASDDGAAIWAIADNGTKIVAFNLQFPHDIVRADGTRIPFSSDVRNWLQARTGSGFRRIATFDDGKPLVLGNNGVLWTTTK